MFKLNSKMIQMVQTVTSYQSWTYFSVVFKEMMPLALRNHVKSKGAVANTKVCMEEMMSLMDCLGKYNQDKAMCSKEITA